MLDKLWQSVSEALIIVIIRCESAERRLRLFHKKETSANGYPTQSLTTAVVVTRVKRLWDRKDMISKIVTKLYLDDCGR